MTDDAEDPLFNLPTFSGDRTAERAYAWRLRDHIENRDWLSLSADEAEEWESVESGSATLVWWSIRPGGE